MTSDFATILGFFAFILSKVVSNLPSQAWPLLKKSAVVCIYSDKEKYLKKCNGSFPLGLMRNRRYGHFVVLVLAVLVFLPLLLLFVSAYCAVTTVHIRFS